MNHTYTSEDIPHALLHMPPTPYLHPTCTHIHTKTSNNICAHYVYTHIHTHLINEELHSTYLVSTT